MTERSLLPEVGWKPVERTVKESWKAQTELIADIGTGFLVRSSQVLKSRSVYRPIPDREPMFPDLEHREKGPAVCRQATR